MNVPPGLTGGALLLWGWTSSNLVLAVLMALLLEAPRFVSWRWHGSLAVFNRLGDASTVLLIAMLFWVFYFDHLLPPPFVLLRALVFVLFPLTLALAWSTFDKLPASALFMTIRKWSDNPDGRPVPQLDLNFPYFGTCLVAAGVTEHTNYWFFPLATLLIAPGYWTVRSRAWSRPAWIAVLVVALGLSVLGHRGMLRLEKIVADKTTEWLAEWFAGEPNPYRRNSDIGEVGALKMSDRIVFRVAGPKLTGQPFLLRESSFNLYYNQGWSAFRSTFREIPRGKGEGRWNLHAGDDQPLRWLTLYKTFDNGKGMVPLPPSAVRVTGLTASKMDVNQFAALRVVDVDEGGIPKIGYSSGFSLDGPPTKEDLRIPEIETETLTRVMNELGLPQRSPKEIIQTVERYFAQRFVYSTYLESAPWGRTPLTDFLLRTRSGHCEYFATSTVLLLRRAGIPARYAVGYSAQEYDEGQQLYVVRRRHAHAWVLAHVDGRWLTVDTTPSTWFRIEAQQATLWQPLFDFSSQTAFALWRWYQEGGNQTIRSALPWLMVLLVVGMLLRLRQKKGLSLTFGSVRRAGGKSPSVERGDHGLYRIEDQLAAVGYGRMPGETWRHWIQRIERPELEEIVRRHNQARFDPDGLDPAGRATLATLVERWFTDEGVKR